MERPQANLRFRFSMRHLFLLTAICAIVIAICVAVNNHLQRKFHSGYGSYKSVDEWPRALVGLIGSDRSLRKDVEPFGLGGFIDHRSIWRIKPGSPLRKKLINNTALALRAASINHPKAAQLMDSVPANWGSHQWNRCLWYATPGYGSAHLEGMDLYLIAEDPTTGEVIVLHEWIF